MIKKATIFFLIFLCSCLVFSCWGQNIRIDHVITVVANLDSAITTFEELGFTVKRGHLHDNGLLNAHIKFKNNTSFELMSIKGEPKDELAREYADLLKSGEGAVFLAITGISIDSIEAKLNDIEVGYNKIPGKSWDYITFPNNSSLAHLFFIEYHIKTSDKEDEVTHSNSTKGIEAVWIEGEETVKQLLESLGLKNGSIKSDIKLGVGQDYLTNTGSIVLIPGTNLTQRPRIKAISFGKKNDIRSIFIRY